jgi:hypothetical protein
MKHEPISGSTATRFELAPVHSGSDAIRRHAEEGRYVLDRVNLAVTEGASHQCLAFSFAKQGDTRRFAGFIWITDDSPSRERG